MRFLSTFSNLFNSTEQTIANTDILDQDLTEIPLNNKDIDYLFDNFGLEQQDLNGILNYPQQEPEEFSNFVYQALRDSIENLIEKFYQKTKTI